MVASHLGFWTDKINSINKLMTNCAEKVFCCILYMFDGVTYTLSSDPNVPTHHVTREYNNSNVAVKILTGYTWP